MADCDGNSANGCEANLSNSATNCGKCGNSCNGSTCANGACILAQPGSLSYKFGDFQCITADGTDVYFMATATEGGLGSEILYVPSTGGTVQQLPGSSGTRGSGLVEYGQYIYWADYQAGTILETPKVGQSGTTRAVVSGLTQPIRVAVDASNVYWTSTAGAGAASKTSGTVAWTRNQTGGRAWGLTVDATDLYYTDPTLGEVVRVAIATGTATVFAPNQAGARGLFGDATSLYWTTSSGNVMTSPKGSLNSAAIVTGQTNPQEIVVDVGVTPEVAYWANVSQTVGSVSKANATAGSTATVIAPNQVSAQCVAVDATSVYWAVYGGTQILKAPK
jgi:hypothetical protein